MALNANTLTYFSLDVPLTRHYANDAQVNSQIHITASTHPHLLTFVHCQLPLNNHAKMTRYTYDRNITSYLWYYAYLQEISYCKV